MNVVTNISKKISYNYFVKSKYEAGIILLGWEVKCVRLNGVNLIGSYVYIDNFLNVCLIGSNIKSSYFIFNENINKSRDRFLLLKKKEILYLYSALKIKGYTLVPSMAYWKKSFLKIELSLCFGKKIFDKRQILKNKYSYNDIKKVIF